MLDNGSTQRAIAYECGVSQVAVFRYAQKLGLTADRRPSERINRAAELVANGMSYKRAADAVGLSYSAVREGCQRRGVDSTHPCWRNR